MRDLTIVHDYLACFCAGNIEGVESTLAANFRLRGPLFEFDSRDAYIQALRENPMEIASFRILDICKDEDNVAVFYEYRKSSGSNNVAQLFKTRGNKIVETLLVFDPGYAV